MFGAGASKMGKVQGEGGNMVEKGSSKASACMKNSQINERKTEQSCVRNPSKAHVLFRICHSSTPRKDIKDSNFHTVSSTQASPGGTTELRPSAKKFGCSACQEICNRTNPKEVICMSARPVSPVQSSPPSSVSASDSSCMQR